MKAILQERYGPPNVLRHADTGRPEIGPGDVLVRVRAASLNPYDWHMLRGDPRVARLMGGTGLARPKSRVAGIDAAGTVEAVGANVPGLEPGDEVFGYCPGAFAEYARTTPDRLAPKPAALTFEQAAALPIAGTTALRAVRDVGRAEAGRRILVNGAAGGVGTFAVQIAAALGAEVTGVCGTGNVELVRSLGAAHVVDYSKEDFTELPGRYDVILDNVGNRPLGRVRRALAPRGTYILNAGGSPGRVFGAVGGAVRVELVNLLAKQTLHFLPTKLIRSELLDLAALVDQGRVTPVISDTYPLAEAAAGLRRVETGHVRGKLVVTVA